MKTLVTILLILVMGAQPPRAKAQAAPACLLIGVALAGVATVVIVIKKCRPKYYCMFDPESQQRWCRTATAKEMQINGWQPISGPYTDASLCATNCANTNTPPMRMSAIADEPMSPEQWVYVERATDINGPWELVAVIWCSIDDDGHELWRQNVTGQQAVVRARID